MIIVFKLIDYLNLPSLIAFALGILLGFVLMLLIYLVAVLRGMRKDMKRRKPDETDVDAEEVNWLIKESIQSFKLLEKEKKQSTFANVFVISKDLAHDIASKFYPKSKRPLQELTVDEVLVLIHYITDRVDELLNARVLKLFLRGMTVHQILTLKDTSEKVTESRIYKTAAHAQLGKVWGAIKLVNPLYWIKKGTVDQFIKIAIKKISLNAIVITGEETYKIYSKKIFEAEIDDELDLQELSSRIEIEGDEK